MYFFCVQMHNLNMLLLKLSQAFGLPTRSDIICCFSVTDLFRSELNDRENENHYKTNSENVEGIIISPA